jgi:hypothetical protein
MLTSADLEQARAERLPVMALRPDDRYPDELDDVVVKDVETFRMEAMSDDVWWMCCYFRNGERVTWHATTAGPANRRQRLAISTTEYPAEWVDFDTGGRG